MTEQGDAATMAKHRPAAGRWFDEPMRWLQPDLVPEDVGRADVAARKVPTIRDVEPVAVDTNEEHR